MMEQDEYDNKLNIIYFIYFRISSPFLRVPAYANCLMKVIFSKARNNVFFFVFFHVSTLPTSNHLPFDMHTHNCDLRLLFRRHASTNYRVSTLRVCRGLRFWCILGYELASVPIIT